MSFNLESFREVADSISDSVIEAAMEDLADPNVRENIKLQIERNISNLLGIDVNMPLVKPFWNRFTDNIYEQLFEFAGFVKSDPPESVQVAGDYIKEKSNQLNKQVNEKVDTMTSELSKRLMKRKESN